MTDLLYLGIAIICAVIGLLVFKFVKVYLWKIGLGTLFLISALVFIVEPFNTETKLLAYLSIFVKTLVNFLGIIAIPIVLAYIGLERNKAEAKEREAEREAKEVKERAREKEKQDKIEEKLQEYKIVIRDIFVEGIEKLNSDYKSCYDALIKSNRDPKNIAAMESIYVLGHFKDQSPKKYTTQEEQEEFYKLLCYLAFFRKENGTKVLNKLNDQAVKSKTHISYNERNLLTEEIKKLQSPYYDEKIRGFIIQNDIIK